MHLEPASMATFIHAFAEGDKLAYHGTKEDDGALASTSSLASRTTTC